jgi:hypothetical protein
VARTVPTGNYFLWLCRPVYLKIANDCFIVGSRFEVPAEMVLVDAFDHMLDLSQNIIASTLSKLNTS